MYTMAAAYRTVSPSVRKRQFAVARRLLPIHLRSYNHYNLCMLSLVIHREQSVYRRLYATTPFQHGKKKKKSWNTVRWIYIFDIFLSFYTSCYQQALTFCSILYTLKILITLVQLLFPKSKLIMKFFIRVYY